ncbi:conserved hypothetical protein [Bathymodiolus platifrons methanotrophic gill symbiont]|uniref:hypothetical protein n=1 Tax=Bathymodiolus platifrons methanotrophic gill symbiont TaxID=113268 RepID=UPI000B41EC6B|nr:hypothetical protein [Bathymodiolus platifrons methanotrophic gill symbiont]MCK5869104.1 hypothetical protein [Methyloprofundus sp.]TXK98384.1 hypothetical protein BMR10_02570 [Methylococcaceae bacterium CS4]TXL00943.1 hypothetical protein BMR11_01265 [Methylococcaceae bacterium CS5]TXL07003.1 hypothetical protein BMR07_05590 [Methylococcaceae bacterium CS1]TXL08293.1 hypothetical protein BMR09_03250 [Methylococcaceae bacterium CS3]TXL11069.1 hypothetical protein BMR08_05855 [Methylococcac
MNNKNKLCLKTIFVSASLALLLSACSDDEPKQQASKVHNPWDHSHDAVVTDVQKHVFEHDFAEQCVEREVSNSINKDNDRKRFAKPCMCIATFMMKDLTAVEAEKFLKENKSTQSLRIRFENAAYHCIQDKQQAKSPQIFNRR